MTGVFVVWTAFLTGALLLRWRKPIIAYVREGYGG
jgi:hypothetical protein